MFFYFFFQAEDGIRDYKVTGVQTCALPIWARVGVLLQDGGFDIRARPLETLRQYAAFHDAPLDAMDLLERVGLRSEERRVGRECRAGGSECTEDKKR